MSTQETYTCELTVDQLSFINQSLHSRLDYAHRYLPESKLLETLKESHNLLRSLGCECWCDSLNQYVKYNFGITYNYKEAA